MYFPPHRVAGAGSGLARVLRAVGAAEGAGPADPDEAYRALDIRVTGGAAPGYVNDRACSYCHGEQYRSYQSVGMAKSFYRPGSRPPIEDFEHNPFFHKPSQRHCELTRRDGDYWFRRWQLDAADEPINELEIKVDWIIGSGHHVRTYLYQNPSGELYQLPLAWYTQERKWGMQPGLKAADHLGVRRQVRRGCMFCHNAYPDVPEGSDRYLEPHRFPKELPEGTGCQRCHGPGDAHVRTLFSGILDLDAIRGTIVNPGKLRPERRDDVCFQCHMLPTVAVMPVRRFERADYCFRPGKDLADYQLVYVIRERGKNPGERFEINHLLELLRRHPIDSEVPYMDLARGLLSRREYAGALQILEAVSGRFGESPRGLEWSAVALLGQGETEAAELRLRRALELVPDRPEALFNLALVLDAKGEFEAAEARLRAALALRPHMAKAWYYLGKVSAGAGRPKAAVAAYRCALEIDPMHGRSYLGIAEVLTGLGQEQEALRYLRHGSRHARKPEPLQAALAAAAALSPAD